MTPEANEGRVERPRDNGENYLCPRCQGVLRLGEHDTMVCPGEHRYIIWALNPLRLRYATESSR